MCLKEAWKSDWENNNYLQWELVETHSKLVEKRMVSHNQQVKRIGDNAVVESLFRNDSLLVHTHKSGLKSNEKIKILNPTGKTLCKMFVFLFSKREINTVGPWAVILPGFLLDGYQVLRSPALTDWALNLRMVSSIRHNFGPSLKSCK